ncbi:MAG: L,D-transpeptidase family protein [Anaerolineae bacterium]|nr:L,D-transpeptidase family protein [Anaerolineae bacterium]
MSNDQDMNTQPYIPKFRQAAKPVREMETQMWQRPLPEPEPEPVPLAPAHRTHGMMRLIEIVVVLLFLMISATSATIGAFILYGVDWVAPGVSVSGIYVGERTQAEVATALQSAWSTHPVLVESGQNQMTVAAAELGLVLDAEATAVLARQQGRTLASWQAFVANNGRFLLSPVWQYDQGRAVAGLETLATQLAVAPVEAQLLWQNGRFEALPGQPGQELDVAATEAALAQQAALILANGRFEPVMRTIAPAVVDLSAVAAAANTLLAAPLAVQAYDPVINETVSQTIAPETWGTWLRVDSVDGQLDWSLDEVALAAYRDALALGEGRFVDEGEWETAVTQAITSKNPNVNLRIYHHPTTYTVQSGDTLASIGRAVGIPYPWLQQANPGLETLSAGQPITIPSPDEMLPLPPVPHKRVIVSIAQQRAWVYENGTLLWDWPVSTGIADSPTAPGIFQIQSHEPNAYAGNWDLWMPSFMGIYRPVPTSDFMNGFHGFPTRGGSNLLWTGDLGHPVTYGCILLSSENAQMLYDWAEPGVIVEIQS